MEFNNLKIRYAEEANKEAEKNLFKGKFRLISLFWAQVKCHCYLFWAGLVRRECLFVGFGPSGKRSIIGTVTGSLWNNTLVLKRVFWCEGEQK